MGRDFARLARHVLLIVIALCCGLMLVWGFSGTARAQQCLTYDEAVADLQRHGWTVVETIPIEGYAVDRLLVGVNAAGFASAVPIDGTCVLKVDGIPLGPVEADAPQKTPPARGQPRPAPETMRSDLRQFPRHPPP